MEKISAKVKLQTNTLQAIAAIRIRARTGFKYRLTLRALMDKQPRPSGLNESPIFLLIVKPSRQNASLSFFGYV